MTTERTGRRSRTSRNQRTPITEIIASDPSTTPDASAGEPAFNDRISGAFRWMRDSESAPLPTTIRVRQRNAQMETPDVLDAFQRRLLGDPPNIAGWDLAATMTALAGLSGDFWDFTQPHPGILTVTQGDVSGHGIRAGAVMAAAKTATAAVMADGLPLVPSLDAINRQLYGRIGGHFVTMASLRINLKDGEAALVRAGHTPIFHWIAANKAVVTHLPRGVAVGMVDPGLAHKALLEEERFDVAVGDILVLATDGMRESMNAAHSEYGDERLAAIIAQHASEPAAMIAFHISTKARSFRGSEPQHDDEMVVVVKRSTT
jgi:sigma-B regulation protein RsbU (phosphoserine phosphatase)